MQIKFVLPLVAASFLSLPGAAFAQDSGNWAGAYAGAVADANFGWTHFALPKDHADVLEDREANHTALGAGGLIGYNWQYGTTVLGVEGDLTSGNGMSTVTACTKVDGCYTPTVTHDSFTTLNHLDTKLDGHVRARLGWVDGDGELFYAAAGYSYEDAKLSLVGLCFNPATPATPLIFNYARSQSLSGFNIGAGFERSIDDHITARFEYFYEDFGDNLFKGDGKEWNDRAIAVNNSVIRVAVAYHF